MFSISYRTFCSIDKIGIRHLDSPQAYLAMKTIKSDRECNEGTLPTGARTHADNQACFYGVYHVFFAMLMLI